MLILSSQPHKTAIISVVKSVTLTKGSVKPPSVSLGSPATQSDRLAQLAPPVPPVSGLSVSDLHTFMTQASANNGQQNQSSAGTPDLSVPRILTQPNVFTPEQMQTLPNTISQEKKAKWEAGLKSLWALVNANGLETAAHRDASRKILEFSKTLAVILQNGQVHQQQQQQQQALNCINGVAANSSVISRLSVIEKLSIEKFQLETKSAIWKQQQDIIRVNEKVGRVGKDLQLFKACMDGFRAELVSHRKATDQNRLDIDVIRARITDTLQKTRATDSLNLSKRFDAVADDMLVLKEKTSEIDLIKADLKKMTEHLASLEGTVLAENDPSLSTTVPPAFSFQGARILSSATPNLCFSPSTPSVIPSQTGTPLSVSSPADPTGPVGASTFRELRTSCDACTAVKVKCGQGQPHCVRCVQRGLQCHYSAPRRIACVECRAQKIKCGREKPQCACCEKRGLHCTYKYSESRQETRAEGPSADKSFLEPSQQTQMDWPSVEDPPSRTPLRSPTNDVIAENRPTSSRSRRHHEDRFDMSAGSPYSEIYARTPPTHPSKKPKHRHGTSVDVNESVKKCNRD